MLRIKPSASMKQALSVQTSIIEGHARICRQLFSQPSLRWLLLALTFACSSLAACTPRVAVEAPKEPITINLNVKIDHEVRVKVEKDLEEVISEDSDLF